MIPSIQRTIKSYDIIAQDFGKVNFDFFWINELKIFKSLVRGKKILDIGCGTGRDVAMLIESGFECTGIDASQGMLKVASERVLNGKFIKMDFYKLKFPNETFDGFWAAASFLHAPKNDIGIVLNEAKRVLKTGGIGFISLKQKMGIGEGTIKDTRYGNEISRYFAFYEKKEFKNILRDFGLKVIKITTHLEKGIDKELLWLCYFVRKF